MLKTSLKLRDKNTVLTGVCQLSSTVQLNQYKIFLVQKVRPHTACAVSERVFPVFPIVREGAVFRF